MKHVLKSQCRYRTSFCSNDSVDSKKVWWICAPQPPHAYEKEVPKAKVESKVSSTQTQTVALTVLCTLAVSHCETHLFREAFEAML